MDRDRTRVSSGFGKVRAARVVAALLALFALSIGCSPEKNDGPVEAEVKRVERPSWVDHGEAEDWPVSTHVTAFAAGEGGDPPNEGAMLRRLRGRIQTLIEARLDGTPNDVLRECLRRGKWYPDAALPKDKIATRTFSDGFRSAAISAVPKQALSEAARVALDRPNWTLTLARPVWTMRETAYEEMRDRLDALNRACEELALRAVVLMGGADAESKVDAKYIEDANRIADFTAAFRAYVGCLVLQGNSPAVNLGAPIPPIEFQFLWQGKRASGLPMAPLVSGLNADATRTTDSLGVVRIDFLDTARYTGLPTNPVGFELDWDLMLSVGETGMTSPPWTTSLVLPSIENTLIHLELTEKVRERTVEDGPIRKGLTDLLRRSGIAFTTEAPSPEEARFVLVIAGVVSVSELEASRDSSIRQVRARGSLVLRSSAGAVLAKANTVEGLSSLPLTDAMVVMLRDRTTLVEGKTDDQKAADEKTRLEYEVAVDRAGRRALDDAWGVWRRNIAREFRSAFPPIFVREAEE